MMIFRNCENRDFLVMLRVRHLEESASHPLPHQEGVPQVFFNESSLRTAISEW